MFSCFFKGVCVCFLFQKSIALVKIYFCFVKLIPTNYVAALQTAVVVPVPVLPFELLPVTVIESDEAGTCNC